MPKPNSWDGEDIGPNPGSREIVWLRFNIFAVGGRVYFVHIRRAEVLEWEYKRMRLEPEGGYEVDSEFGEVIH